MAALSRPVSDAMVMTAAQFDKLSDDDIDSLPLLPLVIARCAPRTKVRMIEALHRRKRFAAMVSQTSQSERSTDKNLDRRRRERRSLSEACRRRNCDGTGWIRRSQRCV